MKNIIKTVLLVVTILLLLVIVLYGGGMIAQFISGYMTWQNGGGTPGDGTSPPLPTLNFFQCIGSAFTFPYGVAGILICLIALAIVVLCLNDFVTHTEIPIAHLEIEGIFGQGIHKLTQRCVQLFHRCCTVRAKGGEYLYLLNAVLFDLIAVDLTDRICCFVLSICFDKGEILTVV